MKLLVKKTRSFVNTEQLISLTSAEFDADVLIFNIESNETPLIKFTDTGDLYFINNLQDKLDFFNSSEILLVLDRTDLISISGAPFVPTPINQGTYLLTQTSTNTPITTILFEDFNDNSNAMGSFVRVSTGTYDFTCKSVGDETSISVILGSILYNDGENVPSATIEYVSTATTGGFYFPKYRIKTKQGASLSDGVLLNTPILVTIAS